MAGQPKGAALMTSARPSMANPGRWVKLEIERPGKTGTFYPGCDTEKVKVENIPYHGIISPGIGYIKLDGFTQEAGQEVLRALSPCAMAEKLSGLILDLRGNGGGLLLEAVKICNNLRTQEQTDCQHQRQTSKQQNRFKTPVTPSILIFP
jgi:carboxyl-terminal processing protease